MLERKIYRNLLDFKRDRKLRINNTCLMVRGARQVGKTFIIREFGAREYSSFIEINFIKQKNLKDIFDGELSSENILKRISAYFPNKKIVPGNTLLFLDEIQTCGNARTAEKFLAEDFSIDVITSGSLLGLAYWQDDDKEVEEPDSIPVGYESFVDMYSLDFEEFLWANGYSESTINYLREFYDKNEMPPKSIHDKFEELFREYIVVGGMPRVVADYIENKDFRRVDDIQKTIIKDYEYDISKHAKGAEKVKVRACYKSIPMQLAKEHTKFQYSVVETGQTKKKYGNSITWLIDSNLVNVCYNVSEPYMPLLGNSKEDYFKLYLNDTGLLCAMFGHKTKLSILNNTIIGNAKGGIYENIIAECLAKKGHTLYFYKPNDTRKIEFLIEGNEGDVIPIEVKSKNNRATSLDLYIKDFGPSVAYKLVSTGIGIVGCKKTIPHYMSIFI